MMALNSILGICLLFGLSFVCEEGKNDYIVMCLYVDDIICTSSSTSLLAEFKSHTKNEFEMSDMHIYCISFLALKFSKLMP